MKNTFMGLLVGLMGAPAMAAFGVGSTAHFTVAYTTNAQTMSGSLAIEAISFDAANGQYVVRSTLNLAGGTQVSDQNFDAQYTDMGGQYVANCSQLSGTLETITVPAGTFQTCHVKDVDVSKGTIEDVWFGDVPYAIVKNIQIKKDSTVALELQSYK